MRPQARRVIVLSPASASSSFSSLTGRERGERRRSAFFPQEEGNFPATNTVRFVHQLKKLKNKFQSKFQFSSSHNTTASMMNAPARAPFSFSYYYYHHHYHSSLCRTRRSMLLLLLLLLLSSSLKSSSSSSSSVIDSVSFFVPSFLLPSLLYLPVCLPPLSVPIRQKKHTHTPNE